ncbi:hypothetical protein QE152_g29875 [Popillia japonica]|uniref:Uncharacterized protein n=1 Tax=Popillia japonica TaxID=7064 RepID=A0AAW1JGJ9_POPJA
MMSNFFKNNKKGSGDAGEKPRGESRGRSKHRDGGSTVEEYSAGYNWEKEMDPSIRRSSLLRTPPLSSGLSARKTEETDNDFSSPAAALRHLDGAMKRDIDTQRSCDKPGSARAKQGSSRSVLASEGSYTERASVADKDSDWQDEDMMTSPIFKLFEEQGNIKQTQAGSPAKKKKEKGREGYT